MGEDGENYNILISFRISEAENKILDEFCYRFLLNRSNVLRIALIEYILKTEKEDFYYEGINLREVAIWTKVRNKRSLVIGMGRQKTAKIYFAKKVYNNIKSMVRNSFDKYEILKILNSYLEEAKCFPSNDNMIDDLLKIKLKLMDEKQSLDIAYVIKLENKAFNEKTGLVE